MKHTGCVCVWGSYWAWLFGEGGEQMWGRARLLRMLSQVWSSPSEKSCDITLDFIEVRDFGYGWCFMFRISKYLRK